MFSIPYMQNTLSMLELYHKTIETDCYAVNTSYTSKASDAYDENIKKLLNHIKDIETEELIIRVSESGDIVYPEAVKGNEEEEDTLGLLEAAEASEDDEFEYREHSHLASSSSSSSSNAMLSASTVDSASSESTTTTSSSSTSSSITSSTEQQDNKRTIRTRSESLITSFSNDEADTSVRSLSDYLNLPDELHESEKHDDQLPNVLLYPDYDKNREIKYIRGLAHLIQNGWKDRIIEGYHKYALCTQSHLSDCTKDNLEGLFMTFFRPGVRLPGVEDSVAWYTAFAVSSLHSLFAYFALSLIQSPASESSCERVFSQCKWIVGDQRKRMKLSTVAMLLHILGEK